MGDDDDLLMRVMLLEAQVRLLSLAMKGFVALIIGSFVAYLLTKV